ncbi:hypothetical protein M8C21_021757 [Ambrosia artemisiifolia]|uniref:Peptidase A1 domain-containing protein n=1 Tax=Ambrosia artemisiifolia TaxID=4212 RepID=A0AAD5D482_AMBAR|nr:hypothetical protein M8C21_021757 [Ambrosia artemisiifolia]
MKLLIVLLVAAAAAVAVVNGGFPAKVLSLERVFPMKETVEIEVVRRRDSVRHKRMLQRFSGGIVDFNVVGTSDPYYGGLYFTKVKLGSPAKEFNVQIDTGSDVLWVTCSSCSGCPRSSGLQIDLNFFDAGSSSTASTVSCSDSICSSLVQTSDASCSAGNQCGYKFQYGDGSGTSGHYVTDLLHFDTIVGPSLIANSSASITFGCSTYQTGLRSFYLINSISGIFPDVSLNFAGGAAMILKPENYLVHGDPVNLCIYNLSEGGTPWCIGVQKAQNGVSILGDLVLKDKIFVYDLSKKRIGWTDYDCKHKVA